MSTVSINGVTISSTGGSVSVCESGGEIWINGKKIKTPKSKIINIVVKGDVKEINVDSCNKVTVEGNANTVKVVSGDIEICKDVQGSVSSTSGDITCKKIAGSVSTVSGDISKF